MTTRFKVGDHVTWNSEAGHVSGKIIKVHTRTPTTRDIPITLAWMIHSTRSGATRDHIAMHKGGALKKMAS